MIRHAWVFCLGLLALAGCGGGPEPVPPRVLPGNNYLVLTTNAVVGGIPQNDVHALYYCPDGPQGRKDLVWPMLTTEDQVVADKLVVFNGGLSEDVVWKYYPALFAYNGGGGVVEISQPACRQIKGGTVGWTNFAFTVMSVSNGVITLDASQRLPLDPDRPKRVLVEINKADILKAMATAEAKGQPNRFYGTKFSVAD